MRSAQPRGIGSVIARGHGADEGRGAGPASSDLADADLIRRIALGDEGSFRSLFRRWTPKLGRFLMNATGSRETAEDLLQETFLRVFRNASRFEPHGSAGAWIYRIAANLAYSYWRRERVRPLLGAERSEALDVLTAPPAAGPENERLRHAFLVDTAAALGRLDANKRIVFLLKVNEGLTYEQIGDVLCCPAGTAKSRFHHAVHRIQQELEKKDWGEGAPTEMGDVDVG
jgi:RNA polymerase sigma-70 factor, ECF subfamily